MKDTVVFIIQVTQQLMQISARPPLPLLSSLPFSLQRMFHALFSFPSVWRIATSHFFFQR